MGCIKINFKMTSRTLIIILALVAVAAEIDVSVGDNEPVCSAIKGLKCQQDVDCVCTGQRKLFCNMFLRCNVLSIFDIMHRQQCKGVFKRECKKDSDCFCKEAAMICENRECVKSKGKMIAFQ